LGFIRELAGPIRLYPALSCREVGLARTLVVWAELEETELHRVASETLHQPPVLLDDPWEFRVSFMAFAIILRDDFVVRPVLTLIAE
jgi:hypothetical protein